MASPGPDFAIILKQSLVRGRRVALWTSVGIGSGILVHIAYCVLGIGLLLHKSPVLFKAMTWAGAAYLAWLGIQGLRARPAQGSAPGFEDQATPSPAEQSSSRSAWVLGFLTNVLNPKATLFFLALFTGGISPETPRFIQFGYGLWMAVSTAAWFSCVSILFTRPEIRVRFYGWSHWVDRVMGLVLLAIALKLALT